MEPQHLQAGHGWQWIKQGYALFMKAPLLWIVLLLICFIAAAGLSAVPVVGEPLASLLLPVVLAGLMVGCRALEHGEELELAHLFSGFRQHTPQLVTLGGIALVGQFLIFGVMMMVGGATLVSILMSGQPVEDPEIVKQAISGAGFAVLLGLTLFSVLMMAMQFAPMLVYFNNATPVEAMKLSLRAFINNIGAMLVYGMTFMLLAILASIPMMLGWLVLLPIVFTSLYACYRDLFPMQEETVAALHQRILSIVADHIKTLAIKQQQTIYQDDYGNYKLDKWFSEIDYFIDNVLCKDSVVYSQLVKGFFKRGYLTQIISHEVFEYRESEIEKGSLQSADIDQMSPIDFEHFCADILKKNGWESRVTQASGDQGIDVIATRSNVKAVFQCKKYSQPVGNAAVQEIIAGKQFEQATVAAVVSNAPYTPSAKQLASAAGVYLLHYSELNEFAEKLGVE